MEASVLKGEPLDQVVSIVAFLVELFHGFCGASNPLSLSLTSVFRSLQKMTQTSLRRSWHLRLYRRLVADVSGLCVSSAHYTLYEKMSLEWSFSAGPRARQKRFWAS